MNNTPDTPAGGAVANGPAVVCTECGMACAVGEYHPYAACLMFKACHSSVTVRANLPPPATVSLDAVVALVARMRAVDGHAVRIWADAAMYWADELESLTRGEG